MAEETTLLRTSSVSKRFRGVVALSDASIRLEQGEILGIIGPNGAGKTTLFNVIAGAMRPSSGSVIFRGRDITRMAADRRLRLGLARTFQLMKPFVSLTVYDNIVVGATGSGLSKRRARARADEIVDLLDMGRIASRSAGAINAVQAKRLELARALSAQPVVVLLDEIFSGLRPDEVDDLAAHVRALPSRGQTVMMIEHNLPAIRSVSERVLALSAGAVIREGSPADVFDDPEVVSSYLGKRSRPAH
ncbi:ABC transporter ATP-binding protein [Actinomadura rugatobispora]|uniref:ABC transporter ATP-binding protein n=1 Tax=Actinomadura rugatobispora TaxID=1994 RepID=A0ABW1ADW6_9ACTN|nr:ABC transporter ATP-binding protein [Actinomadura rugatobispora]